MTKKHFRVTVLCLLVAALFSTTLAEDVYIRNKQFKGQKLGQGMSTELTLQELADGLQLEAVSDNGFWQLGDIRVPGREEDGKIFVTVRDLKKAGMVVIHSPELETIDISMPKTKRTTSEGKSRKRNPQAAQSWGGGTKPTLVYFGASW